LRGGEGRGNEIEKGRDMRKKREWVRIQKRERGGVR